jgi:methionyl-tRNA formyltransferase
MRIGFAGTPKLAADSLENILTQDYEVSVVITKPDSFSGRGKRLSASTVALSAEKNGIPVLKPTNLDSEFESKFRSFQLDLMVVVAYGKLIPNSLLDVPKLGWFNLHYSLLPRYRGAAPVQRALMNGETETGVTFFKLNEGMDSGPILGQRTHKIDAEDDALRLFATLSTIGQSLIIDSLTSLKMNQYTLTPQSHELASFAPKLSRAEGRIDWKNPINSIHNLIRGCAAGPVAFSTFNGIDVRIRKAKITETHHLEPNSIGSIDGKLLVGTGDWDLELVVVQPADKREMSGLEWFNGLHLKTGKFE